MAKQKVKRRSPVQANQQQLMEQFFANEAVTIRREILQRLLTPARNIDLECQYPEDLTIADYKAFYDRHGLAERVVKVWPEESWQFDPEVYEKEEDSKTAFETALTDLLKTIPLWSILFRADVLSGIGEFGVLLLGLADGGRLDTPVPGVNEDGTTTPTGRESKLLYLRAFDQSVVTIKDVEQRITNPRYGQPTKYSLKFKENNTIKEYLVHWTRCIHLADNRTTSEVFGTPRLKPVFNYLLDVKKIGGGSGEMFWKGGFPGISFELSPEVQKAGTNVNIDMDSFKEQMFLYGQGLQRWLYTTGLTAKPLMPQVADPSGHLDWHTKLIAMTLGVPYRVLLGTEEGRLAGGQDTKRHNGRIRKRQTNYITPMMVRPLFDRLIGVGVLPEPAEYFVEWPDLDAPNDADIADVAVKRTEAFSKYVAGGCEVLMPPATYLTLVHRMSQEEVDAIDEETGEFEDLMTPEEPEVIDPATGLPVAQPRAAKKVVKKAVQKKTVKKTKKKTS